MTRKRTFTKPESGQDPAISVTYKGAHLMAYYSIYKIAREDFGITGTALLRNISLDFLKRYQGAKRDGQTRVVEQMVMTLGKAGKNAD